MLAQQLVNGLTLGCVYALFALGFTLVFGVLGVINLAHGAVFTLGAYAGLWAVQSLGAPLWVALAAAVAVAALLGAAVDRLALRALRARGAPHLVPMITTIGVGIVVSNVLQGVAGAQTRRFDAAVVPDRLLQVAGLRATVLELAIVLLSFALMALLLAVLRRTEFGRALRAVAESPRAAALLGIDVERMFLATSAAAAGLGGMAGVMIGLYSNAVFPQMGQPMLHKGIAVVILGGLGDLRGALLGGLFLGFAEVLTVAYLGSTVRDAVAFGLLFLVLLARPAGLFGRAAGRAA